MSISSRSPNRAGVTVSQSRRADTRCLAFEPLAARVVNAYSQRATRARWPSAGRQSRAAASAQSVARADRSGLRVTPSPGAAPARSCSNPQRVYTEIQPGSTLVDANSKNEQMSGLRLTSRDPDTVISRKGRGFRSRPLDAGIAFTIRACAAAFAGGSCACTYEHTVLEARAGLSFRWRQATSDSGTSTQPHLHDFIVAVRNDRVGRGANRRARRYFSTSIDDSLRETHQASLVLIAFALT